ncbi:FkbM family methyltransferase [Sediminicoccus sp. KRV36]|uniref:FkbM family methyltransferase n=1 Tax=Sediminicoccus sp. KRV36 TaxID=3133721 RepID=UPI00200D986D|nr:FkbM family methyltransferase [Sediminicoccus rosea]UPY35788.1 FkbM family methyltransferase [Sediminicoccus rosea]
MLQGLAGKFRKLWNHPGFREKPLTVTGRGLGLGLHILRGGETLIELTPAGEKLHVPAGGRYTSVTVFLMRDRAEPELAILDRLIGAGGQMLDIGANIGIYTLRAATLVGRTGRVIAVEPGREALLALRANLALNDMPQVTILPVALAAEEGVAQLYHVPLGNDPQAFSLLPQEGSVPSEQVVTRTLDSILEEAGVTRLDLIKMDVEGLELAVLRGGAQSIARLKPMIIFEINAAAALEAHGASQDAFDWLVSAGYLIHRLAGDRLVRITTQPREHGNLVAVHPAGAQPRGL